MWFNPAAQSPRLGGRFNRFGEVLGNGHSFPPCIKGLRHWQCIRVGQDMAHCGIRPETPRSLVLQGGLCMAHCGGRLTRELRVQQGGSGHGSLRAMMPMAFRPPAACCAARWVRTWLTAEWFDRSVPPGIGCSKVGQDMAHCGGTNRLRAADGLAGAARWVSTWLTAGTGFGVGGWPYRTCCKVGWNKAYCGRRGIGCVAFQGLCILTHNNRCF